MAPAAAEPGGGGGLGPPAGVRIWLLQFPPGAEEEAGTLAAEWGPQDGAEKARLERYIFAEDRCRAWLSAALQRLAVGAAAGADPHELRFARTAHGRPFVVGDARGTRPVFNASHDGAWVGVACATGDGGDAAGDGGAGGAGGGVATGGAVGLADFANFAAAAGSAAGAGGGSASVGFDVMELSLPRRHGSAASLANGVRGSLRGEEAAWLRCPPPATEAEALLRFLAVWTFKEAFLKSAGVGLAGDLHRVQFLPQAGTAGIAAAIARAAEWLAADDAGDAGGRRGGRQGERLFWLPPLFNAEAGEAVEALAEGAAAEGGAAAESGPAARGVAAAESGRAASDGSASAHCPSAPRHRGTAGGNAPSDGGKGAGDAAGGSRDFESSAFDKGAGEVEGVTHARSAAAAGAGGAVFRLQHCVVRGVGGRAGAIFCVCAAATRPARALPPTAAPGEVVFFSSVAAVRSELVRVAASAGRGGL